MENSDKKLPETPLQLQDKVENQAEDPETKIEGDFVNVEGSQEVIEKTLEEEQGDPEADEIIQEGRGNVSEGKQILSDLEKEKEYEKIYSKMIRGEDLTDEEEKKVREVGIATVENMKKNRKIVEWKTKEKGEKKGDIKTKNSEFKKRFEFKKEEEEIEESKKEIAKKKEEVETVIKKSTKKYEEMEDRFKNLLSQDEVCNMLKKEDKEELIKILESLSVVVRNEIDLRKLEYMEAKFNSPDKLFDNHAYCIIEIENLEKVAGFFETGLKKLGEEEGDLLEKFLEFLKDHPELLKYASLIALAVGFTFLAEPAADAIIATGILIKVGGAIKSAALIGALLAGYALTDEKQRDKFMAWLCGTGKVYDWAWWGLNKYGEEKK